MKIDIIELSKEYIGETAKLYLEFWKSQRSFDPLLELKDYSLKNQKLIVSEDIKKRKLKVFIAIYNNKVIGFVKIFIEKSYPHFKISEYGYINSIYIEKDFRGKGISDRLINESAIYFKNENIKYIRLDVYNVNQNAKLLFERLEFLENFTTFSKKLK